MTLKNIKNFSDVFLIAIKKLQKKAMNLTAPSSIL